MRRATVITVCLLGLAAPAGALAAGGPPTGATTSGAGVTVPGGSFSVIAVPAGPNTVVERVTRAGASVDSTTLLRGAFGVPGAAADGTATGLSADGRTVVLAELPFIYPPRRTRLVVLDTVPDLHARATIVLPGVYAVDAISPAGRYLYLTHYLSAVDTTRYEVRAYDLAHRQLLAKPLVDPRNPNEKMHGIPMTRAMSADGRWAYTLYQNANGGAPFIHALDTVGRTAFCVDLPAPAGADWSSTRLARLRGGSALQIDIGGTAVAVMDTRTLAVHRPSAAPPAPQSRPAPRNAGNDNGALWALGVGLSALLIALVLFARRRWRLTSPGRTAPIRIDVVSRVDP